jgi:glycosyltransferase involved in cell wall biosynthesis
MNQSAPKKAIVFGSYIFSLINFRKHLLIDLVQAGYQVLALAPGHDEEIVKQLNVIGVQFKSLPLARTGLNPLSDINTIIELRRIFKSYKPTLLITYTIKPVIYGNLVASFYSGIKKLAWITGLGYLETGDKNFSKQSVQKLIHTLYRYALRNTQFLAFQNPDDLNYFNQHRLTSAGTSTTITGGSGVDLSEFQKAAPITDPVIFILIARLIRAKGVIEYLTAARTLKQQFGDNVVCRLIGLLDAENPDAVEESVLDAFISDRSIEYLGFQKDVRGLLGGSSVFVLPSYYREGTPRTALEALAMAKAVITTDNPGCRETVRNGVNGFMIPVRNVDELQSAMSKFIEDRSLITTMGEASYQLAVEKYDVKLVNQHLFRFASL